MHNITAQALEVVSAIGLCLLAFLTGLTAALVLEVLTK